MPMDMGRKTKEAVGLDGLDEDKYLYNLILFFFFFETRRNLYYNMRPIGSKTIKFKTES
jgi:hypothetical protein